MSTGGHVRRRSPHDQRSDTVMGSNSIGILGKVPWRDEYVRIAVEGAAFATFDDWLTTNIEWASSRGGPRWSDAYDSGGIHAFLFRPEGDANALLAGAIAPSRDGAGRRFPLVIASPVLHALELAGAPEALPILLEDIWEITSDLLLEVRTQGRVDLEQRVFDVGMLSGRAPTTSSDALGSYRDWVRDLPLGELWNLVFGEPGAAAAAITLRVILEAIAPYRNVERAKTPLTLRLPLGAAGGAVVCFWIDFVKRASHWSSTIPSFFWSHDGNSGTMLLHLGDPPRCTLAEVWMPGNGRDEVCDLTQPGELEHLGDLRDLPEGLARLVFDADQSVIHLMEAATIAFGEGEGGGNARIRR